VWTGFAGIRLRWHNFTWFSTRTNYSNREPLQNFQLYNFFPLTIFYTRTTRKVSMICFATYWMFFELSLYYWTCIRDVLLLISVFHILFRIGQWLVWYCIICIIDKLYVIRSVLFSHLKLVSYCNDFIVKHKQITNSFIKNKIMFNGFEIYSFWPLCLIHAKQKCVLLCNL